MAFYVVLLLLISVLSGFLKCNGMCLAGLAGSGMSSSYGPQQHYCLRWNNHQHNLLGVLEAVLNSQQYADVSLFCEGE